MSNSLSIGHRRPFFCLSHINLGQSYAVRSEPLSRKQKFPSACEITTRTCIWRGQRMTLREKYDNAVDIISIRILQRRLGHIFLE